MNIADKLTGALGARRIIDNIAGHVDEDSRVRIAALNAVSAYAQEAIGRIEAETSAEIASALGTGALGLDEARVDG